MKSGELTGGLPVKSANKTDFTPVNFTPGRLGRRSLVSSDGWILFTCDQGVKEPIFVFSDKN